MHLFGPSYDADRTWIKAEWDSELPPVSPCSALPCFFLLFVPLALFPPSCSVTPISAVMSVSSIYRRTVLFFILGAIYQNN